MDINVLGSGGVAGLVELVKQVLKPYADKQDWTDARYVFWVTALAFVASLGAAAVGLFANPETSIAGQIIGGFGVHPIVAVFVAAFPIAFGNQIFHQIFDILRGGADVIKGYGDKIESQLPVPSPNPRVEMEIK